MVNPKLTKIAEVMQKAEEFALQEIDGKAEDQLLVAAGLAAVTRNLYINALGAVEAQKVFEYCGGINNDIHKLDGDNDGLACESLR